MAQAGARMPAIYHAQTDAGFLLLEDFGAVQFADGLCLETAAVRYPQALNQLAQAQATFNEKALSLHLYTAGKLRSEMHLLSDWYLPKEAGIVLLDALSAQLTALEEQMIASALEQPQTLVHRDYHSRNLMVLADGQLGWIDFQDALLGPVTYDAVSLLKDAYVTWPRAQQLAWLKGYFEALPPALQGGDFAQFTQWFDYMGIQRHLKVVGIFARLAHRDGKLGYLNDIPRVLGYLQEMAEVYPSLPGLSDLLAVIAQAKKGGAQ
jgi:aminoglycoside/choline kinase family phosphotransferase